jgi:hypothetical protein
MERNPKTTKKTILFMSLLLACFSVFATSYLPKAADARPKRPVMYYYRALPYSRNHVPYEVGYSDYGIYRHFVSPDEALAVADASEAGIRHSLPK